MTRSRRLIPTLGVLVALAGPALAGAEPGGEPTPHPFRPELAWECADAREAVAERMPGVTRTFLESRYARAGCREVLVLVEATTPWDAVGIGACREIGLRLAEGEMPSEPREALAREFRRACVQGATPRDWTGTSTLTPR